jgi:hypothetical protein
MSDRFSGLLPRLFALLLFVAAAAGALRGGFLIGRWAFYRVTGATTVAVVEQCEEYQYVVRKPRPSRYAEGYRGVYHFDVIAEGKPAARHTGLFDSRSFLGTTPQRCGVGDRMAVVYSRLDPAWSRPSAELTYVHLAMPVLFFGISVAALLVLAVVVRIARHAGPGAPH